VAEKIVYGWTNTKNFQVAYLFSPKINCCPDFIYVQHFQTRIPEGFTQEKIQEFKKDVALKQPKIVKTIYEITATALSQPDQVHFATGMANGSTCVWSTNSLNVLLTTRKHKGSVTCIAFFENWKIISGSSQGELNIDNLHTRNNEVSRTNTF
jgi:WD40 repeat protein